MIDKRTAELLGKINSECKEGAFKVLEISDLILSMPKKYKFTEENLKQCIAVLKRDDFVEIKYHDDKVYCLSPLPKGRYFFEKMIEEKKDKKKNKKLSVSLSVLFFLFSFLGAFFAIIISRLIFR